MHHLHHVSLELRGAYDRHSGRRHRWAGSLSQRRHCSSRTCTTADATNRKAVRHNMDLDEAAVTLHIPNDAAFLRTVRLVVASLAADLGYDFDEIEDLRIVADEVAHMAMTASVAGGLIRIVAKLTTPTLELSASGVALHPLTTPSFDPMSTRLLSELVRDVQARIVADRCEIVLCCFAPGKSDS
jgi:hypothetical protein